MTLEVGMSVAFSEKCSYYKELLGIRGKIVNYHLTIDMWGVDLGTKPKNTLMYTHKLSVNGQNLLPDDTGRWFYQRELDIIPSVVDTFPEDQEE